jgi:integrase
MKYNLRAEVPNVNKLTNTGKIAICIDLKLNGERRKTYVSTSLTVNKDKLINNQVKGYKDSKNLTKKINKEINLLNEKLEEIFKTHSIGSIEELRLLLTQNDKSLSLLTELIEFVKTEKLKNHLIVNGCNYESLKKNIEDFQTEIKRKIYSNSMNQTFINDFKNFLIEKKHLRSTTIKNYFVLFKSILSHLEQINKINVDIRKLSFTVKEIPSQNVTLNNEELDKYLNFEPETTIEEKIYHLSLIQFFSGGLRFSDLIRITPEKVSEEEIIIRQEKIKKTVVTIPLNPNLNWLLKKYDYDISSHFKFLTRDEYNRQLKKLFKKLDFIRLIENVNDGENPKKEKQILLYQKASSHMFRRLAITNLKKDLDILEIMEITGHKEIKSLQRYIIPDKKKKKENMDKFSDKFVIKQHKKEDDDDFIKTLSELNN